MSNLKIDDACLVNSDSGHLKRDSHLGQGTSFIHAGQVSIEGTQVRKNSIYRIPNVSNPTGTKSVSVSESGSFIGSVCSTSSNPTRKIADLQWIHILYWVHRLHFHCGKLFRRVRLDFSDRAAVLHPGGFGFDPNISSVTNQIGIHYGYH